MQVKQIVEAARLMVFTPLEGPTESLRKAAADYKTLCERINERLVRCGELLRKGQRSEAIRLAEIEPNLLDLVAQANFPERDSFVELCQYFGVDVPPPLDEEIAAELNEAYAREQPLEELLRQYRRYALARVPLRRRIRLLRQIVTLDAQNLHWKKDLEVFEQERLRQIQKELAAAVQECDLETLRALEGELTSPDWHCLPPEELIRMVQVHRQQVSRQIARKEVEDLTRELHEAWERLDVAEGRRVREAWQQMAQLAQLAPDDPLHQAAAPAFRWLEDEDEKDAEERACRQALASLERALDRGEKRLPVLQKWHREATRGGRNLPEYLQRQYELRVSQLEQAAKVRMWQKFAITFLLTVLLAVSAGWGIYTYRGYLEYRQITESLQRLLQSYEQVPDAEKEKILAEAKAVVDRLQQQKFPHLQRAPLPEILAKIEALWQQWEARKQQWEFHIGEVQKILQKEILHSSDFASAETGLQEAEKLAYSERQKVQVHQLRSQILDKKAAWQKLKDDELSEKMRPLLVQLSSVEKRQTHKVEEIQECLNQLEEIGSQLRALDKQHPDISDSMRKQLALVKEKWANIQKHWHQKFQEKQHQNRLLQLVGNHDEFARELKQYIQQHPDSPCVASYERLLEEQSYWKQLDQWNEYAQRWNSGGQSRWNLIHNTKWQEAFQAWEGFPGTQALEEVKPHLVAIQNQNQAGQDRLQRILENPPFRDVWVLRYIEVEGAEKGTEKFFYFLEPPKITSAPFLSLEYLADYDLKTKRRRFSFTENTENPAVQLAPHVELCKDILYLLKNTRSENWEKNFYAMLEKILTTPGDPIPIDPILRLWLLQEILRTGSQGSYALKDAFAEWRKRMDIAPIDFTANWLNPDAPGYPERRKWAAEFLQKFTISEFQQNGQKAAELWKQFTAHRLPRVQWIGLLEYDPVADRYQCAAKQMSQLAEIKGNVYVLAPQGLGICRVVPIAQIQTGQIQIQQPLEPGALLNHRPIFGMFRAPSSTQGGSK